jgi:hypothetical protein
MRVNILNPPQALRVAACDERRKAARQRHMRTRWTSEWTAQKIIGLLTLALIGTAGRAAVDAATITATSCSRSDVEAAIRAARDGDTVAIPPGVCSWTSTLTVDDKAITIQGAGMSRTVIIDDVPKPDDGQPAGHTFVWQTKEGGITRLTGMTFQGGIGSRDKHNKSMVVFGGDSKTWRIDHVRFVTTRTSALVVTGFTYGVIDHCVFDLVGHTTSLYVHHPNWNGGVNGDMSWTDDMYLGTERAVFVEDNIFNGSGKVLMWAIDGWQGSRVVFRYNVLNNTKITNHGSESSGRLRGARSYEIYNNRINYDGASGVFNDAIALRSGNGVIFNNDVAGRFGKFGHFDYYRDFRSFVVWKQCDGTSPFDQNDGVIYETGTHTGGNSDTVLTDSGKTWTADRWLAYSVTNLTRGGASIILSNSANGIVAKGVGRYKLPLWRTGDNYRITRATACLDQTGRGRGALVSGNPPTPQWPNQVPEPAYAWNNRLNGQPVRMASSSLFIREGRDYYNDQPMPGYRPYTYPHPLTSSAGALKAPTRLRIVW